MYYSFCNWQGVKKFPTGDRCRLMLSDGMHQSGFAILASQMNGMVDSGEIVANCVVLITRYYCNSVADKKKVGWNDVLIIFLFFFVSFYDNPTCHMFYLFLYQMMIILELQVIMGPNETGGMLGKPVMFDPSKTNSGAAPARPTPPGMNICALTLKYFL